MNITTILATTTIALTTTIATLPWVCDVLEAGIRHQDNTVAIYQENFGHLSNRPQEVSRIWEEQRKEPILQIQALRLFAESVRDGVIEILPEKKTPFQD
jgi:hypothetical protein